MNSLNGYSMKLIGNK